MTKTEAKVTKLEKDVELLRSFVMGMARAINPREKSEYQPEFAKKILNRLNSKPTKAFKDAQTFLKDLKATMI